MKTLGLSMLCFSGICAFIWFYDTAPVDRAIRISAGLLGAILAPGGWLFFFEGLKREIIEALRHGSQAPFPPRREP